MLEERSKNMYEHIFKRVEEKYLLTKEQKDLLLEKISNYLKKDQYFESVICNIYFDTDNNELIINSINKPLFKEKLRLRSYKVPKINDGKQKETDVFKLNLKPYHKARYTSLSNNP